MTWVHWLGFVGIAVLAFCAGVAFTIDVVLSGLNAGRLRLTRDRDGNYTFSPGD